MIPPFPLIFLVWNMKPCTTAVRCEPNKWIYKNAHIIPSTYEHGIMLAPYLREADKKEIQASLGWEPEKALTHSIAVSEPGDAVVTPDGDPMAVFGAAPYQDKFGLIWFMSSDQIFKLNRRDFIKNSKFWVEKFFENYDILFNVIDARNDLHIRWLKWIGFEFIADIENFGVEKRTFRQFVRYKDDGVNIT